MFQKKKRIRKRICIFELGSRSWTEDLGCVFGCVAGFFFFFKCHETLAGNLRTLFFFLFLFWNRFFVTFSVWEMGLYKKECKLVRGVHLMRKHEDHENYTFFFSFLLEEFFFFFALESFPLTGLGPPPPRGASRMAVCPFSPFYFFFL